MTASKIKPQHFQSFIMNAERLKRGEQDIYEWQNLISGQDYETICGLLDSIKGKLDDDGGSQKLKGITSLVRCP